MDIPLALQRFGRHPRVIKRLQARKIKIAERLDKELGYHIQDIVAAIKRKAKRRVHTCAQELVELYTMVQGGDRPEHEIVSGKEGFMTKARLSPAAIAVDLGCTKLYRAILLTALSKWRRNADDDTREALAHVVEVACLFLREVGMVVPQALHELAADFELMERLTESMHIDSFFGPSALLMEEACNIIPKGFHADRLPFLIEYINDTFGPLRLATISRTLSALLHDAGAIPEAEAHMIAAKHGRKHKCSQFRTEAKEINKYNHELLVEQPNLLRRLCLLLLPCGCGGLFDMSGSIWTMTHTINELHLFTDLATIISSYSRAHGQHREPSSSSASGSSHANSASEPHFEGLSQIEQVIAGAQADPSTFAQMMSVLAARPSGDIWSYPEDRGAARQTSRKSTFRTIVDTFRSALSFPTWTERSSVGRLDESDDSAADVPSGATAVGEASLPDVLELFPRLFKLEEYQVSEDFTWRAGRFIECKRNLAGLPVALVRGIVDRLPKYNARDPVISTKRQERRQQFFCSREILALSLHRLGVTDFVDENTCRVLLFSVFHVDILFTLYNLVVGPSHTSVLREILPVGIFFACSTLFDELPWTKEAKHDPNSPGLHGPGCTCNPDSSVKLQLLRLIVALNDKACHLRIDYRYLMFSPPELEAIEQLRSVLGLQQLVLDEEVIKLMHRFHDPVSPGLLSKLCAAYVAETFKFSTRPFLANCIESALRLMPEAEHVAVAEMGILENVLSDLKTMANADSVSLQCSFDLLAELFKCSPYLVLRLQSLLDTMDFGNLLQMAMDNPVDGNVFFRSLLVTFEMLRQTQATDNLAAQALETDIMRTVGRRDYRVKLLSVLTTALNVGDIVADNVCCVNSSIFVMVCERRAGTLRDFIEELKAQEVDEGIYLRNLRQNCRFWKLYYPDREKDRLSLETSSYTSFTEWAETVQAFLDLVDSDHQQELRDEDSETAAGTEA